MEIVIVLVIASNTRYCIKWYKKKKISLARKEQWECLFSLVELNVK